jgi:hypothetical protein
MEDLTIVVGGERYLGTVADIPALGSGTLTVQDFGADGTNPTETGIMLILDAARSGFRGGSPVGNDTLLITATEP